MSSTSEGDGEQETLEDSPYSDMKIDVPRLTEFMKELLQTIESNSCTISRPVLCFADLHFSLSVGSGFEETPDSEQALHHEAEV